MPGELVWLLAAEEAKTKSVGGKEYPASDFLYVGDPEKIDTWSICVADEGHVRDGMARFGQDKVIPAGERKAMAKKLARIAKGMGMDAGGFTKRYLSAEADLSHDEQHHRIRTALAQQFGQDGEGRPRFMPWEHFDDYVIARDAGGKLYRIPCEFGEDGEPSFGDAREVTTAYVPVAESCAFLASEAESEPVSGRYPITVLRAGWGAGALNGQHEPHYYPPEFVAQVAEAVHGKPFGRRHPDQRGSDPTGAADPERVAGWLDGGEMAGNEARATVNLFTTESALRSKLDEARQNKKLDLFSVSMLAIIAYRPGVVEGRKCRVAEALGDLYSVDLCQRGGAGGRFLTAASFAGDSIAAAQLAAVDPQSTAIAPTGARNNRGGVAIAAEGATMKKSLLQLLEALRRKNADRCAELTLKFANTAEADYPALLEEVTTAVAQDEKTGKEDAALTSEAATEILANAQRVQSRTRIDAKLKESKLGAPAQKLVRDHLETALATEADLKDEKIDAEIAGVREAFAAFQNVGSVRGAAQVGLETPDKMALAMEAAIGVKDSIGKGVPAFRGLREAYQTVTGDWNMEKLRSGAFVVMRASEAALTSDFPNILLNSMTKRLLQDYAELAIDGLTMLYTAVPISDYKVQDRVREGYLPELAIVNEGADYQEMTYPTDELVTYQLQKRGNILTISEETIRNDDLGAISRFPGRMARQGRFTLKSFITNFFANNPNYTADSVAWFAAGHSNLGATALSQASLIADEIALMTQTEKDSGEPLGLSLDWLMVPPALAATARQINQTDTAGSNAFFQRFGANNERIIVNEKLTDANDYYCGTRQENAPFLEIGFLDGIQNPQIFLANQPTVGTQFTADELQYKVKFPFGGAITDFRGVRKNVVT